MAANATSAAAIAAAEVALVDELHSSPQQLGHLGAFGLRTPVPDRPLLTYARVREQILLGILRPAGARIIKFGPVNLGEYILEVSTIQFALSINEHTQGCLKLIIPCHHFNDGSININEMQKTLYKRKTCICTLSVNVLMQSIKISVTY